MTDADHNAMLEALIAKREAIKNGEGAADTAAKAVESEISEGDA
jgi:hypothetical protein